MRPYLAIIIDSFRAAIASRVLYILLVLITLLFLIVCPINLTETLDWRLNQFQHFEKSDAIVKRLIERGETGKSKSTSHVWSLLSEETQATVRKFYENKGNTDEGRRRGPGGRRRGPQQDLSQLVDELNVMIQNPSFYRQEDWDRFSVVPEAESLLEDGYENLSEERMRRVNRLLIGKALPGLAPANAATISIYYWAYNHHALNFSVSQQQVAFYVSSVTTSLFDKLLLSIGLLVGIVVTANVMPQMFDPGTLNLLLSKPITRAGLYLTRFTGACTQIAICAVYLFTGTWLWMGLAIGIWDQAFLWSIPIYVLVFAIYYSVSALIGLLYRSPILAVVATVVFWATCFTVGSSYQSFHAIMQNQRLYDPLVTENGTVAVDGYGEIVVWDPNSKKWDIRAKNPDGPQRANLMAHFFVTKLKFLPNQIRPTLDPSSEQVLAGLTTPRIPELGLTSFDRYRGSVSDLELNNFAAVGEFPRNTMAMFVTNEGLLLCDRDGKFKRWDSKSNKKVVAKSVGPDEPARLLTAYSAAMNSQNQTIAVHEIADGQHHIVIFEPTEDGYVRGPSTVIDLGTAEKIKCFVAYADNTVVVVAGNGRIVAVDATSMESFAIEPCETTCGIETIATSPDGKWVAMAYANQRLWLMDVKNDRKLYRPSVTGRNDMSSVSFDADSRLCVFDRENRLTVYETGSLQPAEVLTPADGIFEIAYRYLVTPLYTVFPKPGEFHKVTNYLSSTRDTAYNPAVDLIFQPADAHPLSPLWSGLGFMVFMLGLSCWIFNRKDF